MDFSSYQTAFRNIIENPAPPAPYDNPDYLGYVKLNWSRQQRWLKTGVISEPLQTTMRNIHEEQRWIIITEPWCGDAAHIVPFLEKIAALNPRITTTYQLRDSPPFLIRQYLTNGSKSIPKLIVRNNEGTDLFTWGPRPAGCQLVYDDLKATNAGFEQMKTALQKWYNTDKGVSLQEELLAAIEGAASQAV
jgi:hypothetical protein